MLFFKLYNWIKYKTLPTSFLFKNRLFVERDAKHRKVVNNFGLIFRSSKWGMHESANIDAEFKNIFFKFFFRSFFLIILLVEFKVLNNSFFNSLSFFFWLTLDSIDYYMSFVFWSLASFISLNLPKIYLFVFNRNYDFKKNKFNPLNSDEETDVFFSKNDLNWITYSWLISDKIIRTQIQSILLFDSKIPKNEWKNNSTFFFNLYNVVFFSNLNKNNLFFYNNLRTTLVFKNFNVFNCFFENTNFLNNYFKLVTSFTLKKKNNFCKNNFSVDNNKWYLNSFLVESFKNNSLIDTKTNLFFFNDLTFFELNKFIDANGFNYFLNLFFKDSIAQSLNFSKWNRWLYRYSLLHRKSIKFNQKLTFTKRLFHSGFYNSSVFKKNIWNSVYFNSRKLNASSATTFFDAHFNDFFFNFKQLNFTSKFNKNFLFANDQNGFFLFKFFENSYFWHLKRFFILNGLDKNHSFFKIKLNEIFNPKNKFFYETNAISNNLHFNFFIKNRFFFLHPLFFNSTVLNKNTKTEKPISFLTSFEDCFTVNSDLDLFSKNNLSLLSNVSSNESLFFDLKPDLTIDIDFKKLNDNFTGNLKKSKFFSTFFYNNLLFTKNISLYTQDLFFFNIYFK